MTHRYLSATLVAWFFIVAVQAQNPIGLIAHWKFNNDLTDASGNGHTGTGTSISYAPGKNAFTGSAAVFNGTSSFVNVPYQADLNLSTYSICALININSFYTAYCQISTLLQRGGSHAGGNYSLIFFDTVVSCYNADTNVYVFAAEAGPFNAGVGMSEWRYPYFLHTKRWYSVVATFDGNNIKIFVDGQLRNTAASSVPSPIGSSTDALKLGTAFSGGDPFWFSGLMDDMRIYNRVLADSEIVSYNTLTVPSAAMSHMDAVVFPNPASGILNINATPKLNVPVTIEVTNTLGQLMYTVTEPVYGGSLQKQIDVSGFPGGIYFVKLKNEQETRCFKIVVQN